MAFKKAREWLTQTGVLASRPAAFVVFALYGLAWIALGDGLRWHSIATLATWGMTLATPGRSNRSRSLSNCSLPPAQACRCFKKYKIFQPRRSCLNFRTFVALASDPRRRACASRFVRPQAVIFPVLAIQSVALGWCAATGSSMQWHKGYPSDVSIGPI